MKKGKKEKMKKGKKEKRKKRKKGKKEKRKKGKQETEQAQITTLPCFDSLQLELYAFTKAATHRSASIFRYPLRV
jgi:hypothetical protein